MKKIRFELLAPMMYIEDMERAFGVKDLKKLPKLQQDVIDWMRDQNRRGAEFDLKGIRMVSVGKNKEEFYEIQPKEDSLGLQFPARYFEVVGDES
jgi:hypothetical protein